MAVNLIDSADIEITQTGDNIQLSTTVDIQTLESNVSTNTSNIANITGTILWTNPKPSATFGVQQITLNSDDYDIIEWFVVLSNSSGTLTSVRTIKGHNVKILGMSALGNYRSRVLTYNSDTQYTSEDCYVPGNTTDNNQMIPLYAIGYKTGLFN